MKFEIFMSYIPQTKAKNMYNTDSKRESMIHCNKINIFEIFDFFSKGGSFDVKTLKIMFLIFQKFKKKRNLQMNFMEPFKHIKEQSRGFWVALLFSYRKAKAFNGRLGHNGPQYSK